MATEQIDSLEFNIDSLCAYLEEHIDGFVGPVLAQKFSNGQSNPTYRLNTEQGTFVLRRKPSGELLKSAHAVDREFKVISALVNTNVPVARPYHLCMDDSIIGTAFYVMEFIDGQVYWDPKLPGMTNKSRETLYSLMNTVLVNVHSIDIEEAGLSDFGRPEGFLDRQINLWSRQYKASETDALPDMEWLIANLINKLPKDNARSALIHGDFRLDNMMFDSRGGRVMALVDWELSTLGHPYADLAYQCMQLRMPNEGLMSGLGGIDRASLGIPSEDEYVASYCKQMNIQEIRSWEFYLAFSFFRFASILQGVKKRALLGNASSDRGLEMGQYVAPLAGMAVELVKP